MRAHPTALGWIDPDVSKAWDWERAQIRRLARKLGYRLLWPPVNSLVPLVDQVRSTEVDAVITPTPDHLDVLTLHAVMCIAEVHTVCPAMRFDRWALPSTRSRGSR